ncbi:MAG: hypothetical protein E7218_04525 [Anaerofustis stercorihominis]|nr:hypothetical protein [Anaerofustis stercorihominis]
MNEENILKLPNYEGPLELLLSLIAKNEVDIFDIPISLITQQYMDYIYTMNSFNIELATDFVVMAAKLIEIKSKMMLPKETDEETGEEIDPREELVKRLLEYSAFKNIASTLSQMESEYVRHFSREQFFYEELNNSNDELDLTAEMIISAMSRVLLKRRIRIEEDLPMIMSTEEFSVDEIMLDLSGKLREKQTLTFEEIIISHPTKAYISSVFLAILEMYKTGEIILTQEYLHSDILIKKSEKNAGN